MAKNTSKMHAHAITFLLKRNGLMRAGKEDWLPILEVVFVEGCPDLWRISYIGSSLQTLHMSSGIF